MGSSLGGACGAGVVSFRFLGEITVRASLLPFRGIKGEIVAAVDTDALPRVSLVTTLTHHLVLTPVPDK